MKSLAVLALLIMTAPVLAQERIPRGLGHPMDGDEHWYDRSCCDRRDCEPVEPGGVVLLENGDVRVRYWSSAGRLAERLFKKGEMGIRQSKDNRDHACEIMGRPVCVYLKWQGF